jgi:hypothetical protein
MKKKKYNILKYSNRLGMHAAYLIKSMKEKKQYMYSQITEIIAESNY